MRLLCALLLAGVVSVLGTSHYRLEYVYYQPEQIHIAFGESIRDIVVTWSTMDKTSRPFVEYGLGQMNETAEGESHLFVDGGSEKHSQWIHRVTLKNLKPDSVYVYHCGSEEGISNEFSFKTPPSGDKWVVRAAIYGDMGNINAQSLMYLQEETQRGMYDLILHVGDFAYDMDTENASVGDEFMRQLEPLAAYVPYMTCPGNHEEKYNFSNYRNRFSMPGPYESLMYSFDIGPIHFISISTEVYYFLQYGMKLLINQYYWLEQDLEKASALKNRKVRPWIILYGHRPMYCSSLRDEIRCKDEFTRTGIPILKSFGLEQLLYKYGVDLVIWAHEHSYERTWPLYDYKVYNGSTKEPYHNPGAPIHIVTGSAGCQERVDPFVKNPSPWSAFRSDDYGYTRFKAYNHSHIHMEQVSVDKKGEIIDEFWIIKDRHGSYMKSNEIL